MRSNNSKLTPSTGTDRPNFSTPGSVAMGQSRLCSHCLKVTFERHEYKCMNCEQLKDNEDRER